MHYCYCYCYSGSHLPSSLPNRIKQTSSASALSSSSEPLAAELPELPTVHDADLRIFTAVLRASILSKQICASCSVACGSRWKVRPAVCSRARSNLNMQGSLRTLRARECPPHPSNHIHSNLYRADFVFRAHFAAAAAQQVQGGQCSAPSWCATGRSTQSSPLPEARRRTQLQCYVLVLMSTSGVHQELLSSVNHNMICVCYARCVCCACARWIALLWVVCAKEVTCTAYNI